MKDKEYDEEKVAIQQRKIFVLLQLANFATYFAFVIEQLVFGVLDLVDDPYKIAKD